jgi:hypothetical protein
VLFLTSDKRDPIPLLEVALGSLRRVPEWVLIANQKQSILAVENADRAVHRVGLLIEILLAANLSVSPWQYLRVGYGSPVTRTLAFSSPSGPVLEILSGSVYATGSVYTAGALTPPTAVGLDYLFALNPMEPRETTPRGSRSSSYASCPRWFLAPHPYGRCAHYGLECPCPQLPPSRGWWLLTRSRGVSSTHAAISFPTPSLYHL